MFVECKNYIFFSPPVTTFFDIKLNVSKILFSVEIFFYLKKNYEGLELRWRFTYIFNPNECSFAHKKEICKFVIQN